MKAGEHSAEEQSTAQGTSGHANPVNDDLQGALGDFVGTNSTHHRCKCMCAYAHVHACAGLPVYESSNHTALACCLSLMLDDGEDGRKNNSSRLMLMHFGVSTAA